MLNILKQQLDKLWLRTDLFIPDDSLKIKVLASLHSLYNDFIYFISNFEEIEDIPSFDELFLRENYFDYLKLVKEELKITLKDITMTEQLTGIFTGLLGHEMNFGFERINLLNSSNEKKEFLMLHTIKLLSIAYYEQFGTNLPLPDEYTEWINSSVFIWETAVKEFN